MENKPMLSVERELLETSEKACTFVGYEDAAGKLRALLDAPAQSDYLDSCAAAAKALDKPAAQHQGEPVADDQLIEIARKAVLNSTHRYSYMPAIQEDANSWFPHRWVIEAMRDAVSAAEQPAPVAVDTERLDFILSKSRTVTTEILPDGYALYVEEGLMGDKVYPHVKASIVGNENRKNLQRQAIDLAISEVARLNGVKP